MQFPLVTPLARPLGDPAINALVIRSMSFNPDTGVMSIVFGTDTDTGPNARQCSFTLSAPQTAAIVALTKTTVQAAAANVPLQ
jgi:hypothetical protein